jgi:ABC-type glycerol-3-phosphate transport system substrate-binding protein
MKRSLALGALTVSVTLAACGGAAETPQQPTVVTVTVTPPAPAGTTTNAPPPPAAETTKAPPRVEQGVIPDVVGVNHQLAQDTMQAAGFYILTEEDATGAGRLLIIDRNWVVVSQQPAAGKRVPTDTTIILKSKKLDE